MFYFITGPFFLLIQSFLIVSTRLNIFPELFYFPWLVSKGLVPYRDFFDHHGFLLYYFLAPLVQDRTLFFLKLFYFFVQGLSLILLLSILKKVSNKLGFLLGGTVFVLVNYFISDANLWYELVIAFFYLVIFLALQRRFKYKGLFLGILISLVSFIKPTAAIVLLPAVYVTRNIRIIFYFLIPWLIVALIFFLQKGLAPMINGLFLFNSFLSKNYHDPYFADGPVLVVSGLVILVATAFNIVHKKGKTIVPAVLFLSCSFIFIFYAYARYHLVPAGVFFVILIAQTMKNVKGIIKYLFIAIVLFYILFLSRKVLFQYRYFRSSPVWIENPASKKIVDELRKDKVENKKIYVFGNRPEIYFYLDRLPPTRYPLIFPMMNHYNSNLQDRIVDELRGNNVKVIVIPKPLDKQFVQFSGVGKYIYQNYSLLKRERTYEIYVR